MRYSLALEYERPHGYLTPQSRREPLRSRRAQKAMFAKWSERSWPEDMLPTEVQEQEAELKAQIALCGTIGGETGTDLVESCFDIFGWEGGTYEGQPYWLPKNYEPEPEKQVAAPETEKPSVALNTSNWPINNVPKPMFTEPDPWRNGQRTVWDIMRERK